MSDNRLLIGDIGGTNARFALVDYPNVGFTDVHTLQCSDYPSAELAVRDYLDTVKVEAPDIICLAAAGPIVDQRVRFTNNHWEIAVDDLKEQFSISAVRLLNDFEAIAYSVPFLNGEHCLPIGLPAPKPLDSEHYTVGILGPGTGLGTVGLRKYGDLYIPITCEASHCGFAPESAVQVELLTVLRERFGRVSSERVISGPGLQNLHWALSRLRGKDPIELSAAGIFAAANDEGDEIAQETVQLFFEILGQIAGDLALSMNAESGIFVAGGIVKRYPEGIANSRFRSGFENKGRHRALMERIPTQLIVHDQPGLLGASYCALEMSKGDQSR